MNEKILSRRNFLGLVGAAGGSTAVYQTARAMGLLPDTGPMAMLELQRAGPAAKKVAVLGAGISGLTVAYELERVGYDVTIIEASRRTGGRNLTLRHTPPALPADRGRLRSAVTVMSAGFWWKSLATSGSPRKSASTCPSDSRDWPGM